MNSPCLSLCLLSFCSWWFLACLLCASDLSVSVCCACWSESAPVLNKGLCSVFIDQHRKHGMGMKYSLRNLSQNFYKGLSYPHLTQNSIHEHKLMLSAYPHGALNIPSVFVGHGCFSNCWLLLANDYNTYIIFWVRDIKENITQDCSYAFSLGCKS